MNPEPSFNAHNKDEFPPAHSAEKNLSSIVIYTNEDDSIQLEVKLEGDTVWLTVEQMSLLFGRDRTVIGRHIRNIFSEGELTRDTTCAKFAHVGADNDQVYETQLYNLDVIISVGYRVKSIQGTRFRQWASKVLKEYIVNGYSINQKLALRKYDDLKKVVQLMARTYHIQNRLSTDEVDGMFCVTGDYVYALDTLDQYDNQDVVIDNITSEGTFYATYDNAIDAINRLKSKFGGSALFANEKDDSFKSSIGQIYQTFDGVELYPSVEEKISNVAIFGSEESLFQRWK